MRAARSGRVLSFTIVALLVAAAGVEDAASQSWTYRAAPQPLIRSISPFANNPVAGTTTLIVSTLTDGMYKGTDTGTTITWQKINTGIPVVQVRTHSAISANPVTDIYAATQGAGVYKTINGGGNWTAINGSGATALGCLDVRSITVDTTTIPRTLLVSTWCLNNSGVYRSTDDGATWARLGPATGPGSLPADVQSSGPNRFDATNMYLATGNYGIFKSTDDGLTWATANNGIPGNNVFNVALSGASGTANLLAYVHGSGIYRSTDSGATWTPSNGTPPNVLPAGFAALGGINRESPQPSQTLYIGLDKQGVYKTTDGGLNWLPWGTTASTTAGDGSAQYTRAVAVAGGGRYYLGTLNGVLKTTDNALTFSSTDNTAMQDGGRINAITHDRDASYAAYVALHFPLKINYIYGDYNNDALFTPLDNGVTGATNDGAVYQDRFSPATPAPLYVSTNNRGIFKSTNGGTSFSAINNGLPSMIGQTNRLAFDPALSVPENSKILYLGLSDAGGVYKSTDGGANWVISSTGLSSPLAMSVNQVTVDPNNSAIVWIATGAGVFKSVNSGANWTLKYSALDGAGSPLPTGNVRVRPGNSSEIYIANNHVNANGTLTASSGILKSIDGGGIWTNILPNQKGSQVRVTVGGDIYAGVSAPVGNPAVYLSTNGGTSFSPYSTNLLGSDIRAFGIASDDSAMISLSLENGFYTNDAIPVPPTVPLTQTITEAPNVFQKLVFPPQTLGTTSAPKTVTIKNLGATAAIIVGFASNNDAFVVQGHTCGASLAAGASCTVSVVFAPNPPIAGETQGTLTVAGSVSGFSVGLWGVGASATLPFARVRISPGAVPAYPEWFSMGSNFRELSFGNQAIGISRTLSYTLTNFGGGLLNINAITVDNARFVLGGTCGATLAAGTSCLVSFTYTPTAVGTDLGNVAITTDSTATVFGQLNFSLTGVGETAGAAGSLLSTFGDAGRAYISTGPYGTESVLSLAHQVDGKTLALVMARKTVEDGVSVPAVVRLNTNGTLDNTFGTNGIVRLPPPGMFQFDTGSSIFAVANDKILVTLNVANVAGTANDTYVYRLLPNGQIDAGFGTAGSTFVANLQSTVRIAPDQKIVLGGLDSTQPLNNALIFTRLTVDGIVDTGFGTNGRTDVALADAAQGGNAGLEVASDSTVVYAYSYGAGAARDFALFRLTANGLPDATWGTAGRVNVAPTNRQDDLRATRLQGDGKILLLSRTRRAAFPANQEFLLARLNSDGSLDGSFGTGGVVETLVAPVVASGSDFASALRVLADGRIIVAGRFNSTLATGQDIVVMRYLSNGTLDPAFGSGGIKTVVLSRVTDAAYTLDIDADGTIVIGGDIAYIDNDRSTATVSSPVGTAHVMKLSNPLATTPPSLVGAQSRRVHGGSGPFDLPLSGVTTNPTTEPRQGPAQTIVFMFDKPIASAAVTIAEGTATPAAPTFSGNGVIVNLANVTNMQYVTVSLTNVAGSDGSTGGSGSARIGFLAGDVNQNRVVTISDLGLVNAQLAQPVTATNYLKDVNASGTLTLSDKGIANANLTKALPPP